MSLLGFDALGHLPLGNPGTANNINLAAAAGSFSLVGKPANEIILEANPPGPFALTGVSASFTISWPNARGAFALTGGDAQSVSGPLASGGSFTLNGQPAGATILWGVAPGAFTLKGNDAGLVRTGAEFDSVYGGVGHYRLEQERAKQLAKITRKAPGPIDRTTAPQFKPIGSPPIAPPAPVADLAAIQNQRATAQTHEAAAKKRRRDEEAILLLAS